MKMITHFSYACVVLLAPVILIGATEKLNIVATFLPYYAHARQIAGDRANVESLLDRGTGPHDFQFKPSDLKKLSRADLLIANGMGLEDWLDPMIKKSGNPKLIVLKAGEAGDQLSSPSAISVPGVGHEQHAGCDHGAGANPHVWLDPVIAQTHVETILKQMVKLDSPNKSAYESNAGQYQEKLRELDQRYRVILGGLKNRNLITFRDAFPYFARRYGLNYLGYIGAFPEKSPTPKALAGLVDVIRKNNVKVLFAEVGYTPKLLESIARQTGARVASLETLEVGELTPDAYLNGMNRNLDTLKKCFAE